jgi:hypothetical protein
VRTRTCGVIGFGTDRFVPSQSIRRPLCHHISKTQAPTGYGIHRDRSVFDELGFGGGRRCALHQMHGSRWGAAVDDCDLNNEPGGIQ